MLARNRWYGGAAVAAVVVMAAACSKTIESDAASGLVNAASISLAATAPGLGADNTFRTYLYSERDVDVFSRPGGGDLFEQGVIVRAIAVEVGDDVRAGDLLAVLEDDEAVLAVESAEAKAVEAGAKLQRFEVLREREVVAPSEYEAALARARQADAELKRAQLDLSRTRVRAPFDGVVAKRYIRERELVKAGTPLFRITAMSPLRARLLVPEWQAPAFGAGAPVQLSGVDGQTATAQVLLISPTVDPASGTREVIVELAAADGFRPGASVAVEPLSVMPGSDR